MERDKSPGIDPARRAFLIYLKDGQSHRDLSLRLSTKAHRKGRQYGFDHPQVQMMWGHFLAGWNSKSSSTT